MFASLITDVKVLLLLVVLLILFPLFWGRWVKYRNQANSAQIVLGDLLQAIFSSPSNEFHLHYEILAEEVFFVLDSPKLVRCIPLTVWQAFNKLLVERGKKIGDITVEYQINCIIKLTKKAPSD